MNAIPIDIGMHLYLYPSHHRRTNKQSNNQTNNPVISLVCQSNCIYDHSFMSLVWVVKQCEKIRWYKKGIYKVQHQRGVRYQFLEGWAGGVEIFGITTTHRGHHFATTSTIVQVRNRRDDEEGVAGDGDVKETMRGYEGIQ